MTSRLTKLLLATFFAGSVSEGGAQELFRTVPVLQGTRVEVINRSGRVVVAQSSDSSSRPGKELSIEAVSAGPLDPSALEITQTGAGVRIEVRQKSSARRIDVTVRSPEKMHIVVETTAGEARIAGRMLSVTARTDTGTIAADIPTDRVRYLLRWTASRPRYLSEFDLEKVREKTAGKFEISGTYAEPDLSQIDQDTDLNGSAETASTADQKKKKAETAGNMIDLRLETARGIILINIPPNEVSSDLRERPLTNAAKAIVRSGDSLLMEAIRRAAPEYYADYARTLPPAKFEPTLTARAAAERFTSAGEKLAGVRVSDSNNRAVSGLSAEDFEVLESGSTREIISVRPSTSPFSLVLLLDVSGSVDNYVDFIRKAARNFVNTVDARDRVSIITFNEDVTLLSRFTTDKRTLSESLDTFDAGGSTALYDALAYTLADTLRPLKGDRTAIVVLTDGDDNRSFLPFDSMLASIQESGALIYPLYVPSALVAASAGDPNTSVDQLRERYLRGALTSKARGEGQKLANVSGGVYYEISRLSDIQTAYEDIVRQLRTSYEIHYRSELGGIDSGITPRLRIRTKRPGTYVQIRSVEPISR